MGIIVKVVLQCYYINHKKATSSFKTLIANTTWIKRRSKYRNIEADSFTVKNQNVNVITLDDYILENNMSCLF